MKTLILVGGGHAHLHCLEQLKEKQPKNFRIVLISPSSYQYYSGMFSGYTEGFYNLEEIRINLKKLCEKIGVKFIEDEIISVHADMRKLTGKNGTEYHYDLVSFDIGSRADLPTSIKDRASSIKPNYRFAEQLQRIRSSTHPVVVGGGASGVELAFSILAWRKQQNLPENVLLFSSTSLLSGQGDAASKKIEAIASRKALSFYTGVSVRTIAGSRLLLSTGQFYPQSDVLWLTGPKSSDLFRHSGLPTDDSGYLLVNDALQSVKHPEIFGAGDCINIDRYPSLPKNGVYAVRQGPILWTNLNKCLSEDKLNVFNPQKRYVSILSTGGGEAFLSYGTCVIHGKIPWKLKRRIDRKFMKRYQAIYQ
ncbi:pyridine nucleotide-disulfide oxidoreductase [Planococcus sp. CPCC 101016]|uniref:FAD-dependent oxidoreductase n=1 Tax=Planococcus sp. CPCC 101016 TaxID=2599617 RepID=UPI0011B5A0FD|nr:FAD-dependent oxidoreductase [Planococcus sp. CPCC 101016]TWT07994.1 pyridine nucleotide-disulfide oxidoreductase [Planococcus sp. CPCC 101016]